MGKDFSFQIEVLHKRDYFRMESPGDGVLRLELTEPLEQHRGLYPWWGEVEGEDGRRREYRGGNWDRRAAAGEEVVLAVRSSYRSFNEVANDEVIRAKVVFTEEISPHEPNDSAETAEPIKVGEEFAFQINPRHDRDYFRMESPGDGVLRLELTEPLEQHRGLYPWWGEVEDGDGRRREYRGGNWDRRAAAGEEVILAVRSNYHSFNEVASDEVIQAKVVFTPEESEVPPKPGDTVRRWTFPIERTPPSQ